MAEKRRLDWPNILAGAAISVLITLVNVYFTRDIRTISYDVTHQLVVPANKITGLSLIDQSGAAIKNDVTALQLILWNSGSSAVNSESVHKPITISCDGVKRVLNQKKVVSNRIFDNDFYVQSDHPSLAKIVWKHLEPGVGVKVNFLVEGAVRQECIIDGFVSRFSLEKEKKTGQVNWIAYLIVIALTVCTVLEIRMLFVKLRCRFEEVFSWKVAAKEKLSALLIVVLMIFWSLMIYYVFIKGMVYYPMPVFPQ